MNADATNAARRFDHALLRGIVVVGFFAGITSVARVLQDAVIAWRFGAGPVTDSYYFLVNLANWPVAVAVSVFTLLVVPLEATQRRDGRDDDVHRFRRELFGAVLLLAGAALPLAWLVLDVLAGSPLLGLEARTAALASAGVPALVAVVPLGTVGALLAAWLVADRRHILTLLEAIPALVVVVVVLLLPGPVLFWATAFGAAVQVAAMAFTLRSSRSLPSPRLGFDALAWHGIATGALLLLLAQVLSALLPPVDAFFAVRLGEGTLATLNFANRLVLGLQGLAGLALQRVSLPLLSHLVAASPREAHRAVVRWSCAMGLLGIAIAAVVALLADPVASALFEHGRFTAADRNQVATLLRWGVLQLVPFLAGAPVVAALASSNARGLLAVAAALGLLVKIAASATLVGAHGAVGLQIATAIMYCAAGGAAWLFLRHRLRQASA